MNYSPTPWGLVSHLSTCKSPRMPHVSPGWGGGVSSDKCIKSPYSPTSARGPPLGEADDKCIKPGPSQRLFICSLSIPLLLVHSLALSDLGQNKMERAKTRHFDSLKWGEGWSTCKFILSKIGMIPASSPPRGSHHELILNFLFRVRQSPSMD